MKKIPALILVLFCLSTYAQNQVNLAKPLPYILDMVHDNPGEEATISKYTDPAYLQACGFTGMVPQWYIQCGITYDSYEKNIIPEASKERKWIIAKQKFIHRRMKDAIKAGIPVYPFTDVFVIPTLLMDKYRSEIIGDNGKPDIHKPLTQELMRIQLREIFQTFPELEGIVVRFGETYLQNTPYHSGNNPNKENIKGPDGIVTDTLGVQGHIKLLNILREEVCVKLNKKVFYRTWDFGWLHTNRERYLKITDAVEPHSNLIFSIKYTNGDFHRMTPFNQTLGYGRHSYIVEFQGQPEYVGKGAFPVYMFGGMLRGYEENPVYSPKGMEDLKHDPRFVGIWTWSRGGGWRGPYIKNELFCDINTRAAALWAMNRSLSEHEVLHKTLSMLGVEKNTVKYFERILELAEKGVLRGHYTKLPDTGFNVWWTRDQFISDAGSLNEMIERTVRCTHGLSKEKVLGEKEEGVAMWKEIEKLSGKVRMKCLADEEYVRVGATYGRILHEIYSELFHIYVYLKEYELKDELSIDFATELKNLQHSVSRYDELWKEFRELETKYPATCASLYEPNGFSQSGIKVSGNKQYGAASSVEKAKVLIANSLCNSH